ncbi:condensin complex subunit 2 [Sitophilus oryzae]|uniref:Condensin complex subunit 2 n=1 Tax=Sitophilus oryzae TaxID=7048 RepID=A0A6J2YP06_SITOR|nr:condensin complex subunit 2 [Sitophilus oryzae]
METSTPKGPNTGIFEWASATQTPLRKQRPSVLFEKNEKTWKSNDDHERANRRASIVARRSILVQNAGAEDSPGLNDSIKALSEQDIKSQLFICSKLNAENKINADNAWKLKVIELLNQFVRKDNPDVLKVAGNSLEVAGKVYGIRVDDLHAESLKLASNLARTVDQQKRTGDDKENENPNASETENGPTQKKKRQKKRRSLLCEGRKHTINHDVKTFREPLPKLESAAFSAKVDNSVSAIENLFTNNLRTDNAGFRFIFLADDKGFSYLPGSDPSIVPETITIENDEIPNDYRICTAFKDFEVDVWDPNGEAVDVCRKTASNSDIVLDENGVPIPELDGSVHNVFQEPIDDDINEDDGFEEEVVLPPLYQENGTIIDFRPSNQVLVNSVQRSDYSYNTVVGTCMGKIDQLWAGPSHWKMKHVRRTKLPVYTGQDKLVDQDKDKKKARKKAEPIMLDFSDLEEPVKKYKLMSKKRQTKEVNENKITLPLFHSACREMIEHIEELILIPSKKPINKDKTQIDCEVEEYRFDNPNDSNYIPNHLVDDDNQPDLADDIFGDEPQEFEGESARGGFVEDNLVGLPEMVTQSDLHYAQRAKKMDMKKLKTAVWQILTCSDTYDTSAKVTDTNFSNMYKVLPQKVTESMRRELSCPLAFVALLHLCNEQNLFLRKGDDISDFFIMGPS